jgi:hypothetical protein
MALTPEEAERINDSRMKIQTIARSLRKVNPTAIPKIDEIESCLEDAEASFTSALKNRDKKS